MFIRGAITRITAIRFSPHEWILVCDATCNTHVMTHVMFHIIIIYESFMCNSWKFMFAAGKKEETNYRNTHNLSLNGHNIMFICGAITRIMRIRFKLMVG